MREAEDMTSELSIVAPECMNFEVSVSTCLVESANLLMWHRIIGRYGVMEMNASLNLEALIYSESLRTKDVLVDHSTLAQK